MAKTESQGGTATAQQSGTQAQEGSAQGLQGSQQRGQEVQIGQGEQGGAMQERGRESLARYGRDPFTVIRRLSDEMDQLFDSFFYGRAPARMRQLQPLNLWVPEVEIEEEGNQLRVCVDLPGITKDNVKVDINEGVLTIQGERREEHKEGSEQQGFRRTERRYGSFCRSVLLPEGVDAGQAQARMKDGVLEVTLPLTAAKQAKRLEIQS